MKKLTGLVLIGLVLVCAFLMTRKPHPNTSPSTLPSTTPPLSPVITVDPNEPPTEITLIGEYVCLPHKETNGPQTMECALGIKLEDNTYVALDMGDLLHSAVNPKLATGSQIRVTGLYVPIEQLNTDMWQKYPLIGIMKVKKISKLP